jgi:hypothetical protein
MLLSNEIHAGEIYVEDKQFGFSKSKPQLFQMVEEGKEIKERGLFTETTTSKINPKWENIATGELVDWGTHCFTTIERIKRQYFNIDLIQDKDRAEYVRQAFELIQKYEIGAGVEEIKE